MTNHTGVATLWCFGPASISSHASQIMRKYRWARICIVPKEERPQWSRNFLGVAYIICESYGEYNGCLGWPEGEFSDFSESDIRHFLFELSADGDVTLVLDDGGISRPEYGGTSGLPSKARCPRMKDAYSVDPLKSDFSKIVPLPYWVPVTIVRPVNFIPEKRKEGKKRKRRVQ